MARFWKLAEKVAANHGCDVPTAAAVLIQLGMISVFSLGGLIVLALVTP